MRAPILILVTVGFLGINPAQGQPPDPPPSNSSSPVQEMVEGPGEEGTFSPLPGLPPALENAPPERLYGRVEYVVWWLREAQVPPLLVASSPPAAGPARTAVVYGGDLQTRHGDRFVGTRVTLGWWFDSEDTVGVEVSGVFLERDSTYFKATSAGDWLLAIPYINPLTGSPASRLVAGSGPEGDRRGGFVGYSRIELFTEEANLVVPVLQGENGRLNLLGGTRFLQMRDRFDLTATGWSLPDQTTLFGLTDHYRVHNLYYGGQVGLEGEYHLGRWFLNLRGEAGLGGTEQSITTTGDQTVQTPTQRVVQPVGLFVQPSNTGRFQDTDLGFVSEVRVNLGYRLTRHLRGFVGYTLLNWSDPLRAAEQVDVVVNPQQSNDRPAEPARPAILFHDQWFWAQGVNGGLEFRW